MPLRSWLMRNPWLNQTALTTPLSSTRLASTNTIFLTWLRRLVTFRTTTREVCTSPGRSWATEVSWRVSSYRRGR